MKRLLFIAIAAALLPSARAEKTPIGEMFAERAKCAVAVKCSIELEENRSQMFTSGMVADDKGLVIIPANELPRGLRHDELKDFKIYFNGGDIDGYPAEYLGADYLTDVHFVRIKGGTPKGRVPFTKFPRAKVSIGDEVWGVGIYPEKFTFEPFFARSYITDIGKRPFNSAGAASAVAAVGSAVFDFGGNFVGWGQSEMAQPRLLMAKGVKGVPISLVSPLATDRFLLPDEIDEILRNVPSKPEGDAFAWIGIVNTKVLERDVAKMMGIENKSALLISDVVKGKPAAEAGLKKGDIIVGINGRDLEQLSCDDFALVNFARQFARGKIGEKITLSVIRGSDAPRDFVVKTCESPKTFRQSRTHYFKKIGFSIREYLFDDALARKAIDKKCEFPVVKYVKPNGPAASALPSKLAHGDIIKEINSKPVSGYAQALEELEKIESDPSAKSLVILAEDYKETKVIRIKLD